MGKHERRRKAAVSQRVQTPSPHEDDATERLARRHTRIGWWSLLVFVSLGLTLEAMHGFKFQWYVGEDSSTRRLMWTLAHAHGTLLSLIHLTFAGQISRLSASPGHLLRLSSWSLSLAGILLPGGFFAGGIVIYDGDPGLGILLVPVGGGLLFVAVLLTAIAVEFSPISTSVRNSGGGSKDLQ